MGLVHSSSVAHHCHPQDSKKHPSASSCRQSRSLYRRNSRVQPNDPPEPISLERPGRVRPRELCIPERFTDSTRSTLMDSSSSDEEEEEEDSSSSSGPFHVYETIQSPIQTSRRSQPVPIQSRDCEQRQREDEDLDLLRTQQLYEQYTWNMYLRIMTARQKEKHSSYAQDELAMPHQDETRLQDEHYSPMAPTTNSGHDMIFALELEDA